MNALMVGGLALFAEGLGVAIGITLFYFFNIKDKKLIGMLYGVTSGIMIAMICFDILPEATSLGKNSIVVVGVIIGILLGLLLEDITGWVQSKFKLKRNNRGSIAIVLVMGIAIHNIPEGFALGTIAVTSPDTLMQFAFIICLHSIPEAIALAIPFKLAGTRMKVVCLIPFILGAVMGVGAIMGVILSQISDSFIALALGLAAGIILYIVCEELLPQSRKIWNGRMTSVATIIGIMIGMFLVA